MKRTTSLRAGSRRAGFIHAGLAALVLSAACSTDEAAPVGPTPEPTTAWSACAASDRAFVHEALLVVKGRRPYSEAEIDAYVAALTGLQQSMSRTEAKRQVALAMTQSDEYLYTWYENFVDALQINRLPTAVSTTYGPLPLDTCFGAARERIRGTALAEYVRDHAPAETDAPAQFFLAGDILMGSLELDDLTPIYRANLFHLMKNALPGNNVAGADLEFARRNDFGAYFEDVYLHRNPTCLECHNSKDSESPYAPILGDFEASLFGSQDAQAFDVDQYRAMFRFEDISDEDGDPPWGWSKAKCGAFVLPTGPDPYDVDAYFGPLEGKVASVWTLETTLREGFETLRNGPHPVNAQAASEDPTTAYAYLVAANVVRTTWLYATGSDLTIATYFPRSAEQRDLQQELTALFISSGYSLRTLLAAMVAHPAFALAAPASGCGETPEALPPLFDPFNPGNDSGDRMRAIPGRQLLTMVHDALEWPAFDTYPSTADVPFVEAVGMALSRERPGYDGLDLQSRLVWEDAFASCVHPNASADFVSSLAERARAEGASVGDAVAALKERLLGTSSIGAADERAALEELLGVGLDDSSPDDLEVRLRHVCGAYLSSPQFLYAGVSLLETGEANGTPLTPEAYQRSQVCTRVDDELTATGMMGTFSTCL